MKRKVKHYKALTLDELHDIYRNRVSVFVVEQNCPYQEIDGNDKVSCICSWITDHEGIKVSRTSASSTCPLKLHLPINMHQVQDTASASLSPGKNATRKLGMATSEQGIWTTS